jgi:hypothetical protein
MEGIVFEWNQQYHHGRIADDSDIWYSVTQGNVEDGFDLAEGDRVSFQRGSDHVTQRNQRLIKTAVNVRILSKGDK